MISRDGDCCRKSHAHGHVSPLDDVRQMAFGLKARTLPLIMVTLCNGPFCSCSAWAEATYAYSPRAYAINERRQAYYLGCKVFVEACGET